MSQICILNIVQLFVSLIIGIIHMRVTFYQCDHQNFNYTVECSVDCENPNFQIFMVKIFREFREYGPFTKLLTPKIFSISHLSYWLPAANGLWSQFTKLLFMKIKNYRNSKKSRILIFIPQKFGTIEYFKGPWWNSTIKA